MTAEQLSANLVTVGRQASEWIAGVPVKTTRNLLCGLLIVWTASAGVQLIATLSSRQQATVADQTAVVGSGGVQQRVLDIESLQSMNLFGAVGEVLEVVAPTQPAVDEVEANAAKTKLNLTLEGIVYSSDPAAAAAVIVHSGKQELFRVNDKIPVGQNVSLARVLLDRVILDNSGNFESLWLYDDEQSKAVASRPVPARSAKEADERIADLRGDGNITDMAQDYRERLFDNPSSLAEVVRITPAQEAGQMIGYRISPGKDREQFERLGLKANDIVTGINGIDLNEPSNALEVYKLMRTAKEANFTISRNGEPLEILVSLGGDQ